MMLNKSCPRCRGDLFLNRNEGPAMWNCLQCGRVFDPAALAAVTTAPAPAVAAQGQAA